MRCHKRLLEREIANLVSFNSDKLSTMHRASSSSCLIADRQLGILPMLIRRFLTTAHRLGSSDCRSSERPKSQPSLLIQPVPFKFSAHPRRLLLDGLLFLVDFPDVVRQDRARRLVAGGSHSRPTAIQHSICRCIATFVATINQTETCQIKFPLLFRSQIETFTIDVLRDFAVLWQLASSALVPSNVILCCNPSVADLNTY